MPPKGRNQRGIFPIIIKVESVKATQPERTKSTETTPLKGTERVHSVPFYNIKSYQLLYSKKTFTQKVSKNWERFNS